MYISWKFDLFFIIYQTLNQHAEGKHDFEKKIRSTIEKEVEASQKNTTSEIRALTDKIKVSNLLIIMTLITNVLMDIYTGWSVHIHIQTYSLSNCMKSPMSNAVQLLEMTATFVVLHWWIELIQPQLYFMNYYPL